MRPASLGDAEACALAERVTLLHAAELDHRYPGATPTEVTIELDDDRLLRETRDTADGDPSRPLDREQLLSKFRRLATGVLPPARIDHFAAVLARGVPSPAEYAALLRP